MGEFYSRAWQGNIWFLLALLFYPRGTIKVSAAITSANQHCPTSYRVTLFIFCSYTEPDIFRMLFSIKKPFVPLVGQKTRALHEILTQLAITENAWKCVSLSQKLWSYMKVRSISFLSGKWQLQKICLGFIKNFIMGLFLLFWWHCLLPFVISEIYYCLSWALIGNPTSELYFSMVHSAQTKYFDLVATQGGMKYEVEY